MEIEEDLVEIASGVRHGYTLGSPITLVIKNDDFKHWEDIMGEDPIEKNKKIRRVVSRPRPGHADLNGALKSGCRDMRNVLDRSSARVAAARVTAGAVAKKLLQQLGIVIISDVREIDGIKDQKDISLDMKDMKNTIAQSPVKTLDRSVEQKMMPAIDQAKKDGDSIGGIVEVCATGMPPGIG